MKTLFTFLFLGFFVFGFGQQTTDTVTPIKADSSKVTKYTYCQIVGVKKLLSTNYNIILDVGQETKFFTDQRLRDEQTGMVQSFNSPMDALNFMGQKGWELVTAFQITDAYNTTFYYLMKKRL